MGIKRLKVCFASYASANIAFREFARSDIFPLFEATKKGSFNKFLLWSSPEELPSLIDMIENIIGKNKNDEMMFYSITKKQTGAWVGVAKFIPYQDGVEGSFWIHPEYHGSIIVYESLETGLEITFNHPNIEKIYARINVDNILMQRLVRKCGFVKVGETQDTHQNGDTVLFNVYLLEKTNWEKKHIYQY